MRSPSGRLGTRNKVFGGTGILPVRCTGWKPEPPKYYYSLDLSVGQQSIAPWAGETRGPEQQEVKKADRGRRFSFGPAVPCLIGKLMVT
jgi:hypothetical protein